MASRSSTPLRVTAWVQLAGLVVLLIATWFVHAPTISPIDLVGGAIAGLAVSLSFVAFYGALDRGQMSLLTPVVAIVGAVVPVVVELARGRGLSAAQLAGMFVALVAIVLVVQRSPDVVDNERTPLRALGLAALSGFGFSFFFLALGETSPDAGLWPLVVTRSVSGLTAAMLALVVTGGIDMPNARSRKLVVVSGIGDVAAMTLLLLALQRGPVAVATVVVSIYPIATVAWARVVLGEQLRSLQWAGIALVFVALPLIAFA